MDEKSPQIGTVVICRITRVLNYGVFVELLDYKNTTGFVHISEIASRWVKNIRNHVKENQIRAAKILSINTQKQQIDLSLIKVSTEEERSRIDEWKHKRRAEKLIEVLAKKRQVDPSVAWKNVADPLLAKFETLYDAFVVISQDGVDSDFGIAKDWASDLVPLCETSFTPPEKSLSGLLKLSSNAGDGVERIKSALKSVREASKSKKLELTYTGSGRFLVRVFDLDFKSAEKSLSQVSSAGIKAIESLGGTGSFEKIEN